MQMDLKNTLKDSKSVLPRQPQPEESIKISSTGDALVT